MDVRELPDARLVVLAATLADRNAFAELVRRHRPGLLAFLLRLAGNEIDIEDLTQTAFLKAYHRLPQFRSDSSFKTWLFRIGYTEFLQLQRTRKYQDRLERDLSVQGQYIEAISPDLSLDLQSGLARLSFEERAAILLCDAVGLTNKDASEAMSVPLGSVKTYLKRARRKMRVYLEGAEQND